MNKIILSSLLSLTFIATPIIQAQCPLRCDNYKAAKTIGLGVGGSAVAFFTAAFVQYKKEQKLASTGAVDENPKFFFTEEQLEKLATAKTSIIDFLTFATKIYVNAHKPTTYAVTFETYPKLTVLALSCSAVSFASFVKAFVNYKADRKAEAVKAQEAADKAAAEKKQKEDEKKAQQEEQEKADKIAQDEEQKKREDALVERIRYLETLTQDKKTLEEFRDKLAAVETELSKGDANKSTLEEKQKAIRAEIEQQTKKLAQEADKHLAKTKQTLKDAETKLAAAKALLIGEYKTDKNKYATIEAYIAHHQKRLAENTKPAESKAKIVAANAEKTKRETAVADAQKLVNQAAEAVTNAETAVKSYKPAGA